MVVVHSPRRRPRCGSDTKKAPAAWWSGFRGPVRVRCTASGPSSDEDDRLYYDIENLADDLVDERLCLNRDALHEFMVRRYGTRVKQRSACFTS